MIPVFEIVVAGLILLSPIPVFYLLFRAADGWHNWKYRNPYDRTCKKCGRRENVYRSYGDRRTDKWEPMNSLNDFEWCKGKRHGAEGEK